MIRPLGPKDLPAAVELVRAALLVEPAVVRERLAGPAWCFDDGAVRAVGSLGRLRPGPLGQHLDLWSCTHPNHRRRGIGGALFRAMEPEALALGADVLETGYRCDDGGSSSFWAARGFELWFVLHTLAYDGPDPPVPELGLVELTRPLAGQFMELVNRCFTDLRQRLDVRPARPYADPRAPSAAELRRVLDAGPDTWLAVESGRVVGALQVANPSMIDLVAVDPRRRRAGLGTQLTVHGINILRRRGADRVLTAALDINTPARNMYRQLGFVQIQSYAEARLLLSG